jgi:hypothetical protein
MELIQYYYHIHITITIYELLLNVLFREFSSLFIFFVSFLLLLFHRLGLFVAGY